MQLKTSFMLPITFCVWVQYEPSGRCLPWNVTYHKSHHILACAALCFHRTLPCTQREAQSDGRSSRAIAWNIIFNIYFLKILYKRPKISIFLSFESHDFWDGLINAICGNRLLCVGKTNRTMRFVEICAFRWKNEKQITLRCVFSLIRSDSTYRIVK